MKVAVHIYRLVDCIMTAMFVAFGVNCYLSHHYAWSAFFFAFILNTLYLDIRGNEKLIKEIGLGNTEV